MKTVTPVEVYLGALNKNIIGLDPGVGVHARERFELAAVGVRGGKLPFLSLGARLESRCS